jgi:hypothetical protein
MIVDKNGAASITEAMRSGDFSGDISGAAYVRQRGEF